MKTVHRQRGSRWDAPGHLLLGYKEPPARKGKGWDSVHMTLTSQGPAWPRVEERAEDKVKKWHGHVATQTDSINTRHT